MTPLTLPRAPLATTIVRVEENGMKIVNLTPHALNLLVEGEMVEIPSTGLARCATTVDDVSVLGGVRIVQTHYGEVTGLPAPEADTIYVVSAMVLAALGGSRDDVFGPADYIRDEANRVVGARALTK